MPGLEVVVNQVFDARDPMDILDAAIMARAQREEFEEPSIIRLLIDYHKAYILI